MIEKVLPGIFRIELPLPDLSLQSVNAYLLKGKERNLIIDSGIDKQECRKALIDALRELDANLEKTDFFITHLHEDHFGLAPELASNSSTIYINAPEAAFWGVHDRWAEGFRHGEKNGFPREELDKFIRKTPDFLKILPLEEMKNAVEVYRGKSSSREGRLQIVGDGESINVGEYSLKCLATPGHSSGHLCLYEPGKKLLFSGDHILETITPAIFLWPGEENRNPLNEFFESLEKVNALEVELVLPGHRRTFQEHRGRVSELKNHHFHREHEIAAVLESNGKSGKTAYEIASGVSWHIPLPWEEFTTELKWMALAETLAHLKYMQDQKKVTSKLLKDKNGEKEYYFLLTES
ncbi:MAG: MBL fold metallo-hydrolase [Dethiobacteria bacterium]|jgi:glyoxylase-like metal-dependent hydrolase (beta-lactamase superfamily II)